MHRERGSEWQRHADGHQRARLPAAAGAAVTAAAIQTRSDLEVFQADAERARQETLAVRRLLEVARTAAEEQRAVAEEMRRALAELERRSGPASRDPDQIG
jgi:hypothetical protein